MNSIHQFVAGFSYNDAITNEAMLFRDLFRSWGYKSEIYCPLKYVLPELQHEVRDVGEWDTEKREDQVALLHLSIGSVSNLVFADSQCKKAILYHNVTPPEFFRGIQEQIAHHLAEGRAQVASLAGVADVVMADSGFNAKELQELGYGEVAVLPLVLDLSRLRGKPNRALMREFSDGLANIVFVGRCAPNKKIEDLMSAFSFFQQTVEPRSRFIQVGSYVGTERYQAYVQAFGREHHVDHFLFMGAIRQDQLNAVYQKADLFLSMSEHEGFCIPLIESMTHDVPVLAYAGAAVPETLDGAGVLFHEKYFEMIAEMMGKLIHDTTLRSAVLEGQRNRLKRFEDRNLEQELRDHLAPLLTG